MTPAERDNHVQTVMCYLGTWSESITQHLALKMPGTQLDWFDAWSVAMSA
jgi:hypothetical protein